MNEILQCKVCGFIDCRASNGDLDWCTECNSIEQGFKCYEETDKEGVYVLDEVLYDEDLKEITI